jgi:hypothetical protein
MPHRALLKALEDIELEAEQTSVRKIVIAHPDHVRELTRIIKSCEISRDSKLREHEIVMHHRLCQQAFRVLIRLTNGLDVNASPSEQVLRVCRAEEQQQRVREVEKIKAKQQQTESTHETSSGGSSSLFGWDTTTTSAVERRVNASNDASRSNTMSDHEIDQFHEARGKICRLVGTPGSLRFYLSKTTSTNEQEASLAVVLLQNLVVGGGPRVSCRLSGYLLSPLLSRAHAPYKTILSISTSTCVYNTLRVLLMHPAYPEDRMLEFDTNVNNHGADSSQRKGSEGSTSREEGSEGRSASLYKHNKNIPFADTYENRTHERLLSLGLIESMIAHIGCGIPHPDLMEALLGCLFELLSGSNLMFMGKDEEAKRRIDRIRKTAMEKCCLLQYASEYQYDMFVVEIMKETTMLDVLQWLTVDVQIPKWVREFQDVETHLPYPWNLVEAGRRHPCLQAASARALCALVASIPSVDVLIDTSLLHPRGVKLKRPIDRHLLASCERNRQYEEDAAEAAQLGEDADNEEDERDERMNSDTFHQEQIDTESSASSSSSSDGEEEEGGMVTLLDLQDDIVISDDSMSESSDDSGQDIEKWEHYVHVKRDEEEVMNKETRNMIRDDRIKISAAKERNRLVAFRTVGTVYKLLERIDEKKKNRRSIRKLTSALLAGVKKNWHRRLILKATTANRGGRSSLGSAGLIASLRRLSQRKRHCDDLLMEARRDLREEVFGR